VIIATPQLCTSVWLLQHLNYVHQLTAGTEVLLEQSVLPRLFWNFLHAMEYENSSQCSQQPAICPYPEPHKSSSLPPNPIYIRPILILSFPSTFKSAEWSLSLRFHHHNTRYMRRLSHTTWPALPNNIWAAAAAAVSFITLFSPLSSYWAPLGSKSPPRHLITEHPQRALFVSITDQVSHP
jgi:hypothetical protein